MAIQFLCETCRKPIEVDDEFANRSAQCPYCSSLVSVPAESTFAVGRAASPPIAGQAPPLPPPPWIAPRAALGAVPAAGRATGALAFAAAVVAVICQLVSMVATTFLVVQRLGGAAPTRDKTQELVRQVIGEHPWLGATQIVALVLAVLALITAVISLSRRRQGNWRAYAALFVSAAMMICVCGGGALSSVMQ